MKCARCNTDRPPANLTRVDEQLVCPDCLSKQALYQIAHQRPRRD
ncbi:MAG: hypothetical protein ACREKH_00640 [Candidatus Rokuibacteriota bacterium]